MADVLKKYPGYLLDAIYNMAKHCDVDVYVVGGTVRDWVLDIEARDLDLAVSRSALDFARKLSREISATFVLLDEDEETARLVWQGLVVDVALFRDGTRDIRADLVKRDFTINALAIPYVSVLSGNVAKQSVIDPSGGLDDLDKKSIRVLTSQSFVNDPLRLLRAFRFAAETGFSIEDGTRQWIFEYRSLIRNVSPERISYELDCIMASRRAFETVSQLEKSSLLQEILPELMLGEGIQQPSSHHLDVFEHNLDALGWMEKIICNPFQFYPRQAAALAAYLSSEKRKIRLKWAALFHDLGKPAVSQIRQGRITFYNHDRVGADLFTSIAKRLRWSNEKTQCIGRFISLHMWPFHLSNERRKKGVTSRACLKLYKAVDEDLPGLFLLAMADSLAGRGPGKPPDMERELAELYEQVLEVCKNQVEPVLSGPPLVTGKDLIDMGLAPGPLFKEILSEIETAQVEGKVTSPQQARNLVRDFVAGR